MTSRMATRNVRRRGRPLMGI
uniref:Uncharacterized protein n=1 Tax=Arundo donax TaxID=35708 RepID=A0A0A9FK32_ARUDO